MKLLPNINKSVPEAADPVLIKPVSDAIEALDTALGAKPSTLTTTAKTLVGAINELAKVQAGTATFTAPVSVTTIETVTFPKAFSAPPVFVVTHEADWPADHLHLLVGAVTTTTAQIRYHNKSTLTERTVKAHWVAVGTY